MKALTVCGLTAVIFWRLGRKLGVWLGLAIISSTLKFCFETALGILFLDGLWLGLGLNGLWFKPLVLILGLFLSLWAFWDFWREGIRWSPVFTLKPPQGLSLFITFLALAFIVLNFAQTLPPETYFDALVYHLSTLQFWDFHHGLADMPGNLYAHFPFGAELYLWNGFFLGGTQAAKLLNVGMLVLTSLAAGAWVAEEGSLAAGGLTTASILFLPLLSTTTWAAQNDVFVAFFFLLFVYTLAKRVDRENSNWFIVAGLIGGAAWSAKYTAILGLGIAFIIWIFMNSRSGFRGHLGQWFVMKTLILLSLAPWLIKNYVFTGNFFYPYFSNWLGGQSLPPENLTALMQDHETPWVMNHSFFEWTAQIFTRDFDKTVAPLTLAFIPFLFLRGPWKGSARYLLAASLFYLFLGFGISHQLRLLIPAIVLLVVAMGLILGSLDQKKIRSWSWVVLMFGLLSFISLARVWISYYHSGEMATGFKTRSEYLETSSQTRSYYGLTEAVQNLTASIDRLLIVGDARSLYFPKDFYSNSVFDRQLLAALAQDEKDGAHIRRRLKELGIDDLVISGAEGERLAFQNTSYYPLNDSQWAALDDLIQHWTDPSLVLGPLGLYHLRDTPLNRTHSIPDLLLLMKTPKLN
ncbi:MAG TPA: glycosyltransferase family 39 protein [bacterium]|nr:glycosyltransferase family 39 protein [bacterium]